jgi:putative nucleotidyltransferase with HDIG domain
LRLTHEDALRDDPLRALRGVRQAVQFGFTLTPETETAVRAAAPSLRDVSPERVRDELLKLMETAVPHTALNLLDAYRLLPVILPEIAALAGVEQSPPHHEPALAHTRHTLARLVQVEAALFGDAVAAGEALEATAALAPYREQLVAHLRREVEGGMNGRTLLRLAALFHDVGKADTQEIEEEEDGRRRIRFYGHDKVGSEITADRLRRFALSTKAVRHVRDVVAGHMRPLLLVDAQGARPSRRAVYRFFRDIGAAGLDVGLLALADHLATYDGPGPETAWRNLIEMVGALYHFYFEKYDETVSPPPLLDGHRLMDALDLSPGPEVGRLLRLIEEAQAAGQLTSEAEAIAFARRRRVDATTT